MGRSRPSVQSNFCAPSCPNKFLKNQSPRFDKLLNPLVVDSIFTSGIAVEQVNLALTQLADGTEHWVKGQYIPSFYNEPLY